MSSAPPPDILAALRDALDGRYDVERLIASGGMGSVFLGRDATLDRPVAIKVIAPELAASSTLRERFLREARTVARLRHPNIVAVYAAGEAGGLLYFVMEYVDGESVRDRLERDTAWKGPEAVAALRDLARALAYAHAQGVVHRDVKPENILVERATGRALLTDFGVAQALAGADDGGRMTGTGMVIGSPFYMSPEQAAGERALDGRSDVYSLGLVAYEMLSGAPVVQATSLPTAIMKQITERAPALQLRAPDAPPAVAAAIDRALEKEPAARWPDAAAFADALGGAGTDAAPPRTTPVGLAASRRPSRRRAAALAGGLVVALALAWSALRGLAGAARAGDAARNSYLVAPFEVLSGDPQVGWLREGSVSMLSLALSQWSDLSVVDYERSLDLLREAGVGEGSRVSLEDARGMARRARVATVVMGQITSTADSLHAVARLYDVASGRKLDEAQRGAAAGSDPRPLFDALAGDLLDLVGAPAGVAAARLAETTTPSVEAYRAYLEGVRALNRWQLVRADSLFRRSIAADSTFALAHYRLASTMGWRNSGDSAQLATIARAVRHAERATPRERAMIGAYAQLAQALAVGSDGATPRGDTLFRAAQDAYAAVITRDSTDAEAWFGLGDAYYHHRPDGWGRAATVASWSRALRAFERTLALDSAFFLAYTHKIDLYRWASGQAQGVVLEGDSLRLLDEAAAAAYGADRLARAHAEAQARALVDARAWTRADPTPNAYASLAWLHAGAGHFDSAVATLREALARPETREAKTPFILAGLLTRADPAAAGPALREALANADAARLRAEGGADRLEVLLSAGAAGVLAGRHTDVDALARLADTAAGDSRGLVAGKGRTTRWWAALNRAGLGPVSASDRAELETAITVLGADASEEGKILRSMFRQLPYVAYLVLGDRRFAEAARGWSMGGGLPELEALEALARGDTAAARRLAATFPDADSLLAAGSGQAMVRWVTRGRVLQALGDLPAATRWYDGLRPDRVSSNGPVEFAWVLWPGALVASGDLHARLGEAEAAREAYGRYLGLRADPDPALRTEVERVRRAMAALADRAPEQPLRTKP